MKFALIVLAMALCILVGYVARQRQNLRDNDETIKEQSREFEALIRENESLRRDKRDRDTMTFTIETLRRENNDLSQAARDHATNLEMVLVELEPKRGVAV